MISSEPLRPPPPTLSCRLGPPRAAKVGEPIEISFVLTNGGSAPVWVLRWGTPLEDFRGDALRIIGPDGRVLEYQGPMVKRGDPGTQEYVRIEANASTERVVDAASAYSFAAPGRYSVSFDRGLLDTLTGQGEIPRPRDRHRPIDLTCGPVEFEVGAG